MTDDATVHARDGRELVDSATARALLGIRGRPTLHYHVQTGRLRPYARVGTSDLFLLEDILAEKRSREERRPQG